MFLHEKLLICEMYTLALILFYLFICSESCVSMVRIFLIRYNVYETGSAKQISVKSQLRTTFTSAIKCQTCSISVFIGTAHLNLISMGDARLDH